MKRSGYRCPIRASIIEHDHATGRNAPARSEMAEQSFHRKKEDQKGDLADQSPERNVPSRWSGLGLEPKILLSFFLPVKFWADGWYLAPYA